MLQSKIDSILYERTALATKPDELIKQELRDLRDEESIKVAQYMTELPPRELLIEQIRKSMAIAKSLKDNDDEKDD